MSRLYLDASAAAKLVVEEPESQALEAFLDDDGGDLVSAVLLETELRRLAVRLDVDQRLVSAVLDQVELFELPPSLYREAGLLPGRDLRTLDALHVAAALRLDVDAVIAYDQRLDAGAQACGLRVLSPGAG